MAPSEDPYQQMPSPSKPSPSTGSQCNKAYSIKKGETCYAVMQMFKLKENNFYQINPNVECNHLFVGQWLCVKAGGSGN
ncbi:hypothetical protein MLD38_010021 [Melastoma candidum]|uniref:Uncharacterized protein n=1 Tax=Melastoma candidum TaxID=119954 RepID=A0ACB9QYP1_9MYRT|nr:hypothetical protein MLD38_010021 [Melastoma candidum]